MRRGITILASLALAGCGGYGVSNTAPLGSFQKLDAALAGGQSLDKQPTADLSAHPELAGCASAFEYHDKEAESYSGAEKQFALVGLDADGNVAAVLMYTFLPPANADARFYRNFSHRLRGFMRDYWQSLAGAEARFDWDSHETNQITSDSAMFETNRARGVWTRPVESPRETVVITRK